MRIRTHAGFTLIELMIVVAVVGILSAIAYPSYLESIRKSRRADGQAALMDLVQALERFYTVNNTYTGATLPYNVAPQTGTKYYDLSVNLTANTYVLTATPAGAQASDGCGTMTVSQAGAKTAARTGCWN